MKTGQRTKKKIICSCGTCCSSCTAVKDQLVGFLAENGIDVEFEKCNTIDIEDCCKDADLIISSPQLPPKIDKPKISSVPFFTGNGLEEAKQKILKILK
jgi:galactitol-specific phosphotransferase system IIB component